MMWCNINRFVGLRQLIQPALRVFCVELTLGADATISMWSVCSGIDQKPKISFAAIGNRAKCDRINSRPLNYSIPLSRAIFVSAWNPDNWKFKQLPRSRMHARLANGYALIEFQKRQQQHENLSFALIYKLAASNVGGILGTQSIEYNAFAGENCISIYNRAQTCHVWVIRARICCCIHFITSQHFNTVRINERCKLLPWLVHT